MGRRTTLLLTFTHCDETEACHGTGTERTIRRFSRLLTHLGIAAFVVVAGIAQTKSGSNDVPGSLPGIHLVSPVSNGQWTLPAGDYANTRFSPLSQINTDSAKNLHIVSTFSTGIPHGHEGQPLVVSNTMYVVTPFPNYLIALDLTQPGYPMKWKYHPHASQIAVGLACCDVVNRGASYADGKIIYDALDDKTIAVDVKTGAQLWKTQSWRSQFG